MNHHPALRSLFCLFFGLGFSNLTSAAGTNETSADVSAILESFRAQGNIPGMVAVVLRGDRTIAQGAVGVRKRGVPERVTLDDQFHLGSCTKAMTATLAGMLIEEGKLTWTSTLGELFGDTVKNMHSAWKNVTLQEVLAHRAGLPNGNNPEEVLEPRIVALERSVPKQRQLVVAHHLGQQPETPPGTKWVYSNVGYIIAGAALEKITGQSWEDLMQERIFRPLGITTGGFGAPGTEGKVDQPWGHDQNGNPVDPGSPKADNPSYFGPCGSAHMAVGDWAKFVVLQLRADSANPNRRVSLLKPKAFDALHQWTPGETYCAGWFFGTLESAKGSRPGDHGLIFGHEGSNGLWYSKMLLAPEIDVAVLVASNKGGDSAGKVVAEATLTLIEKFVSNQMSAR